ncbi:E3 ubiquitin-protein ligase TRAIP [Neosynchiropus ocellatus]
MPIRALCIFCSDYFDHSRDIAAIHCGHTFHHDCLQQWFQTAPTKTCPQCRKQVSTRHIISKLFFDVGGVEESVADPDCLQNELDRVKALMSSKEREWRERETVVEGLRKSVSKHKKELESARKQMNQKDMLCSTLKKQMDYMETQNSEAQAAKEEARRLRTQMQTYERLNVLLEGQRSEVESMVKDMGVGHAAVEQLAIFCISLKKEYEGLKKHLKYTSDMCDKLKAEVLTSNSKLQKATVEVSLTKEEMKSLQSELTGADKEITSLKKKVEFLQNTLSTPTRTNVALSRLVFESPAPLELKHPQLHQPTDSQDIDLNMTYDITTPEDVSRRPAQKMKLDRQMPSVSKHKESASASNKVRDEDSSMDPFLRNSFLFRKKTFGSMLDPQRKAGVVRSGYDGLGGRTKFIQPSPLAEIRPLMKAKRKKVSRPPAKSTSCMTLDGFLDGSLTSSSSGVI